MPSFFVYKSKKYLSDASQNQKPDQREVNEVPWLEDIENDSFT